MKSKSQVSVEFILIFAIVLSVSVFFLGILNKNLSEINDKKDFALMQKFANNIRNEIVMASQVRDNYVRKFEVPYTINSKNYTIKLQKDELIVNITHENNKRIQIFLPQEVKGGFLENNELGFLDYCISKNNNELRISRNQASLEYSAYDNQNDGFNIPADYDYADSIIGLLSINKNENFRIYLRVNCVLNLQSIDFNLVFDNDRLRYISALKQTDHGIIAGNPNELSQWLGDAYYYDESCGLGCKHITIIKNGKGPLGSGVAAEFEFQAIDIGTANIEIGNLKLIDSSITPTSQGYIPPSTTGIAVEIKP